ncbi:MAG: GNAT family N-acetyltransferase [Monoglobaceae bacterium]
MEQLRMHWKNDFVDVPFPKMPENCKVVAFTELDDAVDKWLDIVQYGLTKGRETPEYYKKVMTNYPGYNENKCFFILENGTAVATITVICDYKKREGLIHMVACCESVRGRGFGTLLSKIAEKVLKTEGMKTAWLTTDDVRIPAIKTYLKAGFEPDLSTEDFKKRWNKIYEKLKIAGSSE